MEWRLVGRGIEIHLAPAPLDGALDDRRILAWVAQIVAIFF